MLLLYEVLQALLSVARALHTDGPDGTTVDKRSTFEYSTLHKLHTIRDHDIGSALRRGGRQCGGDGSWKSL